MRSLSYFPPRIHASVEVGRVEAVNIDAEWTTENLHIYAREIGLRQTRTKPRYLHFHRFLHHMSQRGSAVWVQLSWH